MLLTRNSRRTIRQGDVYFIPPGVSHGFVYPGKVSDFLTLKVEVSGRDPARAEPLFATPSPVVIGLRRALIEATPQTGTPSPSQLDTIELISAALVASIILPANWKRLPRTHTCRSAAWPRRSRKSLAASQGKLSSVKAVARAADGLFDRPRHRANFSAAGPSQLKHYLDKERRRISNG